MQTRGSLRHPREANHPVCTAKVELPETATG